MAHPAIPWGIVGTKMAAAAVRRSDNDIMAKGMCIAARASGNRNGGRALTTPDTARTPRTAMMAEGQTSPREARNEGKDAHTPRVTTPAQRRQQ
jgi:hypothetical protein